MTLADQVAKVAESIPSVRFETAEFVRMDGAYAIVNVGAGSIRVANVGWVPPVAGMIVQLEWRDGVPIATGPAVALNPVGVITGTGTPRATVTVDGKPYLLYIRKGYTPVLGDMVTVSWSSGTIEGAITGQEAPAPPPAAQPAPESFSNLVIKPEDSGRYQNSWWGKEPWASNNNNGIWTYGGRLRDGLRGANITKVEINLALLEQAGNASIGLHPHRNIPGGAPTITDLVTLNPRGGWVRLPDGWGNRLRDNDGGIAVTAPGGGYNRWQSVQIDSWSGALRFEGTR